MKEAVYRGIAVSRNFSETERRWFTQGDKISKRSEHLRLVQKVTTGELSTEEVEALKFHTPIKWRAICLCGWEAHVEARNPYHAEAVAITAHSFWNVCNIPADRCNNSNGITIAKEE